MDKLAEEYHRKKMEYLKNRKPERYILHDTGIGFIVQDTLAHRHDRTDKSDYHLIPEMNRGFGKEDKYKSARDLIDEMNKLDYQVNGNLYDEDKYWVMNTKERLYQELRQRIDDSLNTFEGHDSIKFAMANWEGEDVSELEITIDILQRGYPSRKEISPFIDAFLNMRVFEVINSYLDEVENSKDRDDMIREDTLIELKARLLEKMQE